MDSLEKLFNKEILKSERKRSVILIILLLLEVASLFTIYLFSKEEYLRIFKSNISIYTILVFVGIIIVYDIIILYLLRYNKKIKSIDPSYFGFFNSFYEISLLTLLLIMVIEKSDNILILNSPVILTYFIFIVMSTFRLNYKLSLFTGFLAALQFIMVSYYYTHFGIGISDGNSADTMSIQYMGQGIIMFISGIAAGFVADVIKNKMLATWETIKEKNEVIDLFGQQISPSIAENILQNKNELSGARKSVCIMFLDIRNFTNFVDNKQPEEVVTYLNSLFGFMIDIVQEHNGVINQFLGDGFMATFGAPVSADNSSQNAVDASAQIISKLKQEIDAGKIIETRIGIGLHFDEAVTGNIGSNTRKQYSITGKVVIMASRIEQLNKKYGTTFLISNEVHSKLDNISKEKFSWIEKTKVKGSDDLISLYKYT